MTPKLGLYIQFDFEADEKKVSETFNHLQQGFLQNLRYDTVLLRDQLVPDFEHPNDYFFAKAQLDGRIDLLTQLIDWVPEAVVSTTEA